MWPGAVGQVWEEGEERPCDSCCLPPWAAGVADYRAHPHLKTHTQHTALGSIPRPHLSSLSVLEGSTRLPSTPGWKGDFGVLGWGAQLRDSPGLSTSGRLCS